MALPIPRVPPVTSATLLMLVSSGYRCGSAFDSERDAHAAADAQGSETLLGVTLLHFVQQGDQNAGARGADRMADGDGPAIDVDLRGIPADFAIDRDGLGGEGFIGLDQVEIGDRPAGLLQ